MSEREMKILLVGPCPPPHGGISVHVATAERLLRRAGASCRVLDVGGHRDADPGVLPRIRDWIRLLATVRRLTRLGWTLHLHTNGHNPRSWMVVLACGLAGRRGPGRMLTLHSGMVPAYLSSGPPWRRSLARIALRPFDRIVCVNLEIREALAGLGTAGPRVDTRPAYLPAPRTTVVPPVAVEEWLDSHRPVLSTTLFFRPEYGFELLLEGVRHLRKRHPSLGCLILGGGEGEEAARGRLRERGLAEHVLLAGDVPHELCLELLSRSDVFVRSTLVDGDAISVREALSLGVPVVASDTGSRPPGVTLFPPGDLRGLLTGVEEALELSFGDRPAPRTHTTATEEVERLLATYRVPIREEAPCRPPC